VPSRGSPTPRGHAIEARVYAEDPAAGFLPSPGTLATVAWPTRPDVRVDAGHASGDTVPGTYDPLLAKVIADGADRDAAVAALREALGATVVAGVATNVPWLLTALGLDEVARGRTTTATATRVATTSPARAPAIAAAVARALDRPPSADPWAAIGPFRVSGAAALTFHGDDWEERATARRDRGDWLVRIGDDERPLRWWHDLAGAWTVAFGDEVVRVGFVERTDGLEIAGGGGRWVVREGPRPSSPGRRGGGPADGRVRAPLPGKVLRVEVAVGDRVAAGAPLVTLTAMKIELACEAPVAGEVRAVHCRPDSQVTAGEVLVELALDQDAPGGRGGERA
jgi:acetyl-CoA/propionyl-CoA carboxylase biotin carboxyl carrier protein